MCHEIWKRALQKSSTEWQYSFDGLAFWQNVKAMSGPKLWYHIYFSNWFISKRLIWQDNKRLVLKIYCISLVPLNMCITNTLILHQMIQLLIGILRYFEIYPVYDVWRKVCERKVVIFNFRRRRGIYLESTLTIVKPSKSGQKILFKIFHYYTFLKYIFLNQLFVVLIWNLSTENQIMYFCPKLYLGNLFLWHFLFFQLVELPWCFDLHLCCERIIFPWCSNVVFVLVQNGIFLPFWFCRTTVFPPVLI